MWEPQVDDKRLQNDLSTVLRMKKVTSYRKRNVKMRWTTGNAQKILSLNDYWQGNRP